MLDDSLVEVLLEAPLVEAIASVPELLRAPPAAAANDVAGSLRGRGRRTRSPSTEGLSALGQLAQVAERSKGLLAERITELCAEDDSLTSPLPNTLRTINMRVNVHRLSTSLPRLAYTLGGAGRTRTRQG
mmetsp:Transcript_21194/g.50232  ORF Transcript_21194/g.50232 Transcript_21194/m.50232 type:complete len:130 (+) Transcript_21194:17-406(+)